MPMFIRPMIVPGRHWCAASRARSAGERGLDSDLGGFEVADLTDQDDVRILPQERAQGRGEVQADLLVHLHLVDAVRG